MSQIKAGKIQSGISLTPSNNMVLDASEDDGSFSLKRGDGTEILTVSATGVVSINGSGDPYGKDNVLGTVSQTAGVPTGAVIEAGSNANGEYIKFADGTMICTAISSTLYTTSSPQGGVFTSGGITLTYPATFLTHPLMIPTAKGNYLRTWGSPRENSTTVCNMNLMGTLNDASAYPAYTAIGRWF